MSKIGFIIKVKARGKEYFYLRKSERTREDKSVKRDSNIFAFGQRDKAIETLKDWENDINSMPIKLKDLGYDLEDISAWIEQIESK